ncbi:hypothetical protein ACSV9I_07485 [Rhizobium sp. G187]|uniref:hypothetical protein n=1 Tax=Rhizobium sp. G187 TaxID=3451352 RepID=UPI003EE7D6D9
MQTLETPLANTPVITQQETSVPTPLYPAAAFRGPLFEGRDRIALGMAAFMMLAPLAALPLGFGG